MSYPIVYDELLLRDDLMKEIDPLFDGIHHEFKQLRKTDPRSKDFRTHKVINNVKSEIVSFIRDFDKAKDVDNTTECEDGNPHILTRPTDIPNVMGCEICDKEYHISPYKEFRLR